MCGAGRRRTLVLFPRGGAPDSCTALCVPPPSLEVGVVCFTSRRGSTFIYTQDTTQSMSRGRFILTLYPWDRGSVNHGTVPSYDWSRRRFMESKGGVRRRVPEFSPSSVVLPVMTRGGFALYFGRCSVTRGSATRVVRTSFGVPVHGNSAVVSRPRDGRHPTLGRCQNGVVDRVRLRKISVAGKAQSWLSQRW